MAQVTQRERFRVQNLPLQLLHPLGARLYLCRCSSLAVFRAVVLFGLNQFCLQLPMTNE